MPTRLTAVMRVVVVAASFALLAGACTTLAPSAANPPTPIGPPAVPPVSLTPVARPAGAATPGTDEWYAAPAPSGRNLTLGVYRPEVGNLDGENAGQAGAAPVTVLVLHGGDGFRRLYEDLARRYATHGFIAIAGCWFERTEQPANFDAVDCHQGPVWKGMNASSVADVNALVNAALLIPGVDPHRLVIAGHSYGAGVAMLRASEGHTEPVISSSGFLASSPLGAAVPLPTDEFAIDHVDAIRGPVLIMHAGAGALDFITPPGQAVALASALTAAGNRPATIYFPSPAGHAFPWQPGLDAGYTDGASAWIRAKLP